MDSNSRKVFIGGNWKCNGDKKFLEAHVKFLNEINFDASKVEVAVSPVSLHLETVASLIDKSKYIVSAQNVSQYDNGAYTGEISAKQLKDFGIDWTLVGHSERRQYFHENENVLEEKLKKALDAGLNVIHCIGEKLQERENNETLAVVHNQLKTLEKVVGDRWSQIVIAYEPVWAIGTGKTASPEQAQEVHHSIRNWLATAISGDVARKVRVIYGGSVTDQNCVELIQMEDIDGFLVGGASLKSGFKPIIESYSHKNY